MSSQRRSVAIGIQATFLLSLTLALATAAHASGQFGSAFILSGKEQSCESPPRVAINPNGNAIFTWQGGGTAADGFGSFRARARTRSSTGVFGPILMVSGRSFGPNIDPRTAIDSAGNSLLAWTLFDKGPQEGQLGPSHAQFRTLSSTGALGPITEMSSVIPADSARVAISPNGRAVLFWRRPNSDDTLATMETRTRSATGVLGAIKTVSLFQHLPGISPELAMDSGGDAVFAWQRRFDGATPRTVIQARRRAAGGALGQLYQNLGTSVGTGQLGADSVAIDGQGNAIISWVDDFSGTTRVEMRTLSDTDVLGPQEFISQGPGGAADVQVAINTAGDAAFAYREVDGSFILAKGTVRSAAGSIAAPQTLSPSGANATFSGAAIDGHARSMFVWAEGDFGAENAQARTRSATGALGAIRTMDTATLVMATHVAMNSRGDAAAVWCEAEQPNGGDFVFTVHGAVTPVP